MDVIGGIALKHAVLRDQTTGTFREKDLVAKLDRFLYFSPLNQIGVGFKDRVDLLLGCNLLSLKHAAAALIDNAGTELAIVIDLSSKLVNDNVVHRVNGALVFGLFEYPSGMVDDLLGDPDELAIFTLLLGVALPRCHSLDLLHPTPCRARVVSKALDPLRNKPSETPDEPGEDSHHIPEQRIIGWMMDIGFGYRRVDAQSLTVLQSQIDGGFKDPIIKGLQSLRSKFVKGPIESVVLRYTPAVKARESAQRVPVGDSLAEFPIVPVLDPHKDQRPKHLGRGHGRAACGRLFQTSLKVLADPLAYLWLMIKKVGHPLENRVQLNALGEKLDIGEVNLGVCDACHFLTF